MFIDIKDARKHYGEGETLVNALDGVSLSLGEGKIYVILGPSGSGKSTLLNMIGGLDSLDSGEITISGRNISRSDKKKMTDYRREDVGFVFQFYNLIPDLTVQENIQVVADIAKQPMDIEEVMKALDIDKYKNRFPKELSVFSVDIPALCDCDLEGNAILSVNSFDGCHLLLRQPHFLFHYHIR